MHDFQRLILTFIHTISLFCHDIYTQIHIKVRIYTFLQIVLFLHLIWDKRLVMFRFIHNMFEFELIFHQKFKLSDIKHYIFDIINCTFALNII